MTTPHDAAQSVLFAAVGAALAAVNPDLSITYDRTVPELMQDTLEDGGAEVRIWLNWRPAETVVQAREIGDGREMQVLMAAGDLEVVAAGPDGDGGPGPRDALMSSLLSGIAAQLLLPRAVQLPPGHPCGGSAWMGWGAAALALTDDRSPLAAMPQIAARGIRFTLTFSARSALEAAS